MMIPIEEVRFLGREEAHVLAGYSGRIGCCLCETRVSAYDMTFYTDRAQAHVIEMVELLPLLCSYGSRC